jgi:hypothetical protein
MGSFNGNYAVDGLLPPNSWDQLDVDNTTDLSGVPDVTAQVQATINLIQAAGVGGIIGLPPGLYRINGATISGGGVVIRGCGWEQNDGSGTGKRGKRGTYILTDDTTKSAFSITAAAGSSGIEDMAFIQPQPPDGGGWSPTTFPAAININGGAGSGPARLSNLLFWGIKNGIQIGSLGAAAGITLRDIALATFTSGVTATNVTDHLAIDNLRFVPQFHRVVRQRIGGHHADEQCREVPDLETVRQERLQRRGDQFVERQRADYRVRLRWLR